MFNIEKEIHESNAKLIEIKARINNSSSAKETDELCFQYSYWRERNKAAVDYLQSKENSKCLTA